MFLLCLKGKSEISLTNGGIKSEIYDVTKPALTLNMNESLCWRLLCDRVNHPHSLYGVFNDTDLISSVTRRAASFCNF